MRGFQPKLCIVKFREVPLTALKNWYDSQCSPLLTTQSQIETQKSVKAFLIAVLLFLPIFPGGGDTWHLCVNDVTANVYGWIIDRLDSKFTFSVCTLQFLVYNLFAFITLEYWIWGFV